MCPQYLPYALCHSDAHFCGFLVSRHMEREIQCLGLDTGMHKPVVCIPVSNPRHCISRSSLVGAETLRVGAEGYLDTHTHKLC